MVCRVSGMLSTGVLPPDNIRSGNTTKINNKPNCGIDRVKVARKMPRAVAKNRYSVTPAINSNLDPITGTPRINSTTKISENILAIKITNPLAQTFAIMISNGSSGITSKCSIVPCSRSRISAAPDRMIDSMVIALMISIVLVNHELVAFWL